MYPAKMTHLEEVSDQVDPDVDVSGQVDPSRSILPGTPHKKKYPARLTLLEVSGQV